MSLPLYMTCLFSFTVFRILSLSVWCAKYFDYDVSGGVSVFHPDSLVFYMFPAPG
jgi:hypothetical protein